MTITVNQKNPSGYVVVRANGADGLLLNTVGGNTNDGANAVGETVQSMAIAEVMWSVAGTNSFSVKRGSNTVLTLAGSGYHDYQASGIRIEDGSAQLTSNVDITLSGGTGTLLLKLHKVSGE